jgi:tetratricopeptide (TPR) repeat protein
MKKHRGKTLFLVLLGLAVLMAHAETPEQVRGKKQAAALWRPADGDAAAFEAFARANTASDAATRDALFTRLSAAVVSLEGHMREASRDLRMHVDLDRGPILPFDEALAAYDPGAHLTDDLFENKVAFTTLLNFPVYTLEEKLRLGSAWTRRQWAEARLADRFATRVPASVNLAIAKAQSDSAQYIASYNIWMHHLVDDKGVRLFPAKMRLLSHWNLRDEIKSDYADKERGRAKQRAIRKVMERIVDQTIPKAVLDNPSVDWNPFTNEVHPAAVKDYEDVDVPEKEAGPGPEPDTRYATLLADFRAVRQADPYSPTAPTFIARKFDEDRQIPEARVRKMLEEVLSSPLVPKVAALIEKRLGRKLSPVDVWYPGFRPQPAQSGAELDALVRAKYPTPEAYAKDIPNLLAKLGFSNEKAQEVAARIEVHPARGSGHASGAELKGYKAYLRTRVEKDGMNYKGYNIAVHEMGHNVEQTFSLYEIDEPLLQGVPNTAFTEALAFVFQGHDLELLGLAKPSEKARAEKVLDAFWGAYEIAGVGLVDMGVWHFMYEHPEAAPAELKAATLAIARDVWNRFYTPVLGEKDVTLLAVYSHMIEAFLYLPDYSIGHMIAFQIERQMEKAGAIGPEFERMAKLGNIAPDLWMTEATGVPVGPEALLAETEKALSTMTSAAETNEVLPFIADDYPKALAFARAERKPIFLEAWAPWCHSCRSMRAFVFNDKALERQAGRFVWLSINTEKRENAAVLAKFPVQAWPSFYVIDPKSEKVVLRYVGGATVPQLQRILDDGERATSEAGRSPRPDEILAKADRFFAEGKNVEAADAYRAALPGLPPSSPSYTRTVDSLLFALTVSRQPEPCATIARDAFPHLRSSPSAANVAGSGLDCAVSLPKDAPQKAPLVQALAADAREVLGGKRAGLAVDDVSSLYQSLASAREDAGDETGKKKALEEWAAYLEGEAAVAKTAEGRAAFDAHRITAYLELGQPERGIPMLEASERDVPGDYNPPARLALAYRAMKKYDEALAASDRALQHAYGPRKLVILSARADIYDKKGDRAGARKTRENALAWAEALPKEQVSERQIAALKKQLETPK